MGRGRAGLGRKRGRRGECARCANPPPGGGRRGKEGGKLWCRGCRPRAKSEPRRVFWFCFVGESWSVAFARRVRLSSSINSLTHDHRLLVLCMRVVGQHGISFLGVTGVCEGCAENEPARATQFSRPTPAPINSTHRAPRTYHNVSQLNTQKSFSQFSQLPRQPVERPGGWCTNH